VEADGTSVVFCAIDNLCRGAGSQAVANLNLAMGWDYDLGLRTLAPIP
jgi:N-acetyl-gamma-glutamylphosphate reductase